MNNKKQQVRSRPRPVWVDNLLIRERVARWKARDRAKEWLRRLPRRVVFWVVNLYAGLSAFAFTMIVWWAYDHPHMRIIDGPSRHPAAVTLLHHTPAATLHRDAGDLQRLLMEVNLDSGGRKAFEEYLLQHPNMADSLKVLQQLYPALRFDSLNNK